MKIAVLDDYQDVVKNLECFTLLSDHQVDVFTATFTDAGLLAEKLIDFDVLVLIRERTQISEALLSKLPNLKLISQTGKISNHLDVDLCAKYGVSVAQGIGSAVAPSELCWALIMAASRNIPEYVANLSLCQWQQSGALGLGRALHGLTLGIWGYGKIGQRIAQYAKAFGLTVLVWGSESSRRSAQEHGFIAVTTKAEFFSSSDIVSMHLRLNDTTNGCVTAADLASMKSDSLFVNISRSELVETNALYREMQENITKRAAIDVFSVEPATPENVPILLLPNVLCSPHLGYVEQGSYALYFKVAFENVVAFARGKPQNIVKV